MKKSAWFWLILLVVCASAVFGGIWLVNANQALNAADEPRVLEELTDIAIVATRSVALSQAPFLEPALTDEEFVNTEMRPRVKRVMRLYLEGLSQERLEALSAAEGVEIGRLAAKWLRERKLLPQQTKRSPI
jgi:hypothetical protein